MSLARIGRSIRWLACRSGVVFLGASACGGRVGAIVQGRGSGGAAEDSGPVVVTAPSGSTSGERTSDATVALMDSSRIQVDGGAVEEQQADSSVVDADVGGVASEGGAVPVGACCGQPEPQCLPGVCCAATDCPSSERCLQHVCQSVTCAAIDGGIYYVDPSVGIDDASSTGAANCPYRSVTHALFVVGPDAGAGATIRIINDAFAPVLNPSTGEVFPIEPPANVTIIADDTSKNLPTLQIPAGEAEPSTKEGGADGFAVFALTNPNCRVSFLIVDGNQSRTAQGFEIASQADSIDHVTIENMNSGITVLNTGRGSGLEGGVGGVGSFSVGPGVTVQNSLGDGLFVFGESSVDIKGGRGLDHTSFSANGQMGIYVLDYSNVTIEGADIDPAHPDDSDVDTDNNGLAGLAIAQYGLGIEPTNVVRGLHASGNPTGIVVKPCNQLTVRASFMGGNTQSGVYIGPAPVGVEGGCSYNTKPVGRIDLGNPNGPDYGRNIFEGSDAGGGSNVNGAICLALATSTPSVGVSAWPTVLAAGNIFGKTDCAVGGTLLRAATCSSQVDIGGISPNSGNVIDVSNCE
jgi:uncharacterized protein DUF1565